MVEPNKKGPLVGNSAAGTTMSMTRQLWPQLQWLSKSDLSDSDSAVSSSDHGNDSNEKDN